MAIDNKILIYSDKTSPRLDYVLNLICNDIWKVQWEVTHEIEVFNSSSVGVINYSNENTEKGISITPSSLLFEKGIQNQNIQVSFDEKLPLFYHGDILAMIFYMVSRYEEYLPFDTDNHGRFSASQSLAFKNGFLDKPIVDLWANHLKNLILKQFPFIKFGQNKFKIQPSYDIDIAWAFKNKGFKRQIGGMLKSLRGQGESLNHRLKILSGKLQDPFDTFDYLDTINNKHAETAKYFILIGDYGEFDKNTSHNNFDFIKLLKKLNEKYQIGIHPSYKSNFDINQLVIEKNRLEEIIEKPITRSRQHYLKLKFPDTYQKLSKIGIKEDYSMGYHDQIGFRAGLTIPFYWYDLSLDVATELKIFPFQIMDVTLKQYLSLSVEEAIAKIRIMKTTTKNVGGELTYLWHNSSFYETEGWKGWNYVLESFND